MFSGSSLLLLEVIVAEKWCCNCQKTNHDCWECNSTRTVEICCQRMARRRSNALPEKRVAAAPNLNPLNPVGDAIRKQFGGTWS